MGKNQRKSFPMTWEQAVQWLREQPGRENLVRACFFDDPLPEAAMRFHDEAEWKSVASLLPSPPGNALDLGAGRGIASYALAMDGWKVTALEPDPSALVGAGAIRTLAAQTNSNIEVVEEWGERLPFADNTFDCVHARQVLHHAADLDSVCREVLRVLKPGGIFIATREHVIDVPEDLEAFLTSHPLHFLYGGENAFCLERYLDAIVWAGLRLARVFSYIESPINYFPMNEQSASELALSMWPWGGTPSDRVARKEASQRMAFPGRLYTFVSHAPMMGEDDLRAALEEQASRLTALEAKLEAKDIRITKRLTGKGVSSWRRFFHKLFSRIRC